MDDNKHNGWTNYETWLLKLWLDNDGSDEMMREWALEEAKDAIENGADSLELVTRDAGYDLGERIKEHVEEQAPEEAQGFYGDIMRAGMREVNYREIAESYLGDLDDEIGEKLKEAADDDTADDTAETDETDETDD